MFLTTAACSACSSVRALSVSFSRFILRSNRDSASSRCLVRSILVLVLPDTSSYTAVLRVRWTTHREKAGSCVARVPSPPLPLSTHTRAPEIGPERVRSGCVNYEVTANPLQPRSGRKGKGRGPAGERIRSRLDLLEYVSRSVL
jgi:hypothetical protein